MKYTTNSGPRSGGFGKSVPAPSVVNPGWVIEAGAIVVETSSAAHPVCVAIGVESQGSLSCQL